MPKPIDAIMRALMAKGWPQQRAVATAVNHVKKVCATGRAFGGRTAVSAEARTVACRAVAEWEAKKAAAKALSVPADDRGAVELAYGGMRVELADSLSAAARRAAAAKGQTFEGGRFPVRNRADLARAVRAVGRANPGDRARIRAYLIRRAKTLGAMDLIPDGWTNE